MRQELDFGTLESPNLDAYNSQVQRYLEILERSFRDSQIGSRFDMHRFVLTHKKGYVAKASIDFQIVAGIRGPVSKTLNVLLMKPDDGTGALEEGDCIENYSSPLGREAFDERHVPRKKPEEGVELLLPIGHVRFGKKQRFMPGVVSLEELMPDDNGNNYVTNRKHHGVPIPDTRATYDEFYRCQEWAELLSKVSKPHAMHTQWYDNEQEREMGNPHAIWYYPGAFLREKGRDLVPLPVMQIVGFLPFNSAEDPTYRKILQIGDGFPILDREDVLIEGEMAAKETMDSEEEDPLDGYVIFGGDSIDE